MEPLEEVDEANRECVLLVKGYGVLNPVSIYKKKTIIFLQFKRLINHNNHKNMLLLYTLPEVTSGVSIGVCEAIGEFKETG